jgi:hypothetical protein
MTVYITGNGMNGTAEPAKPAEGTARLYEKYI